MKTVDETIFNFGKMNLFLPKVDQNAPSFSFETL